MGNDNQTGTELQKETGKQNGSGRQKDYRKRARIKSIIFLILAVVILGGIYLNEKRPFSSADETESAAPVFGTMPAEESK